MCMLADICYENYWIEKKTDFCLFEFIVELEYGRYFLFRQIDCPSLFYLFGVAVMKVLLYVVFVSVDI